MGAVKAAYSTISACIREADEAIRRAEKLAMDIGEEELYEALGDILTALSEAEGYL